MAEDQEEEPKAWRDIVRDNNEPGSPNVLLALEDAAKQVEENPDQFNKAFIILYKNDSRGDEARTTWFNAGLRYSEIVFLLEYMKVDFIEAIKGPRVSSVDEDD